MPRSSGYDIAAPEVIAFQLPTRATTAGVANISVDSISGSGSGA